MNRTAPPSQSSAGSSSFSASIAFSALFTVHQTQQALILQFGKPIRVERDPGLKVRLPFIQNVEFFEKRIIALDPKLQEVLLSDQKRINVDAFARYRIVDPLKFRQRAVTNENFRRIFEIRMNSAVRTEVARASLADMLSTTRAGIMDRIADESARTGGRLRRRRDRRPTRPDRSAGGDQPGGVQPDALRPRRPGGSASRRRARN